MNDFFFVCCSFPIEAKGTKLSSERMPAQTHHLGNVVASYDNLGLYEFWSADTLGRLEVRLERLYAAFRVYKQDRETLGLSLPYQRHELWVR
jgi:hypothetical protein